MKMTKKVITQVKFGTSKSSSTLNLDPQTRSILIGRKSDNENLACGFVGKIIESSTGQNMLDYGIWLDLSFPHVVGIFGTRGMGKSFSLGVLAECLAILPDATNGAPPSSAIVLFDVQNQFWTMAHAPKENLSEDIQHLEELNKWGLTPATVGDLTLWTPCQENDHFPAAKIFQIAPEQLRIDDWLAILEQERYSPMGQALIELLKKCEDHNPSMLAGNAILATLPNFQSGTVEALRWRLEAIAEMDLIGSPGVDVKALLHPGKISVVLLRNLPENMRALTTGVLARLLATRMSEHHQARKVARRTGNDAPNNTMPERLWLAIDEAHVIVPSEGKTPASEPLIDYVKRGRDSGMSLIFATQQPSSVASKLMSQVDITLTHGLSFDADIQAATKRMPADASHEYEYNGQKISSLSGVIRTLAPGETIIADSTSSRIFLGQVRPRLTAHGGNTPPNEESDA